MASLRAVRKALTKHRHRLLKLPNVVYLGIGTKIRRGSSTGTLSLRVFVRSKSSAVSGKDRVPKRIYVNEGGRRIAVSTDVQKAQRGFQALGLAGGDRVVGVGRGSVGLAYRSKSGDVFMLTNAHVVARVNTNGFGNAVQFEGDGEGGSEVGTVYRCRRVNEEGSGRRNTVDAAVVKLSVTATLLQLGGEADSIAGVSQLTPGDAPRRYFYVSDGRAKRLTRVEEISPTPPVQYKKGGSRVTAVFPHAFSCRTERPSVEAGDSGSVVVRRGDRGLLACGLLFAGADGGDEVLIHPMNEVLRELGRADASENGEEEDVSIF